MSEPRSTPSWFPEISDTHPVPVERSLAESAEAVFRTQDLMAGSGQADKQRQRSLAESRAAIEDEASLLAFMGRPAPSAIEHFLAASDAADRAEEAERKQREARRIKAQEERIAQLEAEVATAATRAERLSRNLSQANEGWGAERRRSEGASFRGTDDGIWQGGYEQYQDGTGIWKLRRR